MRHRGRSVSAFQKCAAVLSVSGALTAQGAPGQLAQLALAAKQHGLSSTTIRLVSHDRDVAISDVKDELQNDSFLIVTPSSSRPTPVRTTDWIYTFHEFGVVRNLATRPPRDKYGCQSLPAAPPVSGPRNPVWLSVVGGTMLIDGVTISVIDAAPPPASFQVGAQYLFAGDLCSSVVMSPRTTSLVPLSPAGDITPIESDHSFLSRELAKYKTVDRLATVVK